MVKQLAKILLLMSLALLHYVFSYIATNLGSPRNLMKTFQILRQNSDPRSATIILGLSDIQRADLCRSLFDTFWYVSRNVQFVDKTKDQSDFWFDIFNSLATKPLRMASSDLHFLDFGAELTKIGVYPIFKQTVHGLIGNQILFTVREITLSCLAYDKPKKAYVETFISYGYNNNTFFIYERSGKGWVYPIALMEQGPQGRDSVVELCRTHFGGDYHYATQRLAAGNKARLNPLLHMNEFQKYRLLALIFDAKHFKEKGIKFLDGGNRNMNYPIEEVQISILHATTQIMFKTAMTIKCQVRNEYKRANQTYYVTWGFVEDSVYLFQKYFKNDPLIHPVYYISGT